jgi:hypothetical protein
MRPTKRRNMRGKRRVMVSVESLHSIRKRRRKQKRVIDRKKKRASNE